MAIRSGGRFIASGLIAVLLAITSVAIEPARPSYAASPADPPGPDRVTTITVDFTAYEWWMATWKDNQVVCSLVVDHKGQPTLGEIYQNCDQDVYFTFKDQPRCNAAGDRKRCEGYYLVLIQTSQSQRQMTVMLPPAQVWLSLEGCDSVSRAGTNICENTPILVLTGQEPLPNEHILRIEGTMDGEPFRCDAIC